MENESEVIRKEGKRELFVRTKLFKLGQIDVLNNQFFADFRVEVKWHEVMSSNVSSLIYHLSHFLLSHLLISPFSSLSAEVGKDFRG